MKKKLRTAESLFPSSLCTIRDFMSRKTLIWKQKSITGAVIGNFFSRRKSLTTNFSTSAKCVLSYITVYLHFFLMIVQKTCKRFSNHACTINRILLFSSYFLDSVEIVLVLTIVMHEAPHYSIPYLNTIGK